MQTFKNRTHRIILFKLLYILKAAEVAVVMVHNMVRKKRYQLVPIKLVNQSDMMQSKLKL